MTEQELEAKFHVAHLDAIKNNIEQLGASLIQARVHEMNLRFDTPTQELRKQESVLRLRMDDQARMTFKGPGQNEGGVISREEIEFVVEDFDRAKKLIEALGYQVVAFYEKYRTTYELGHTHIMLDELPYGDFVEIEGTNVAEIQEVAQTLNLRMETAIKASYLSIFEQFAKIKNIDPTQLSFEALKNEMPNLGMLGISFADEL
ncbi:MAG: class IV adenylate cyclase [Anaerolineales bacterium]